VWPKEVAPLPAHLLLFGSQSAIRKDADALYEDLRKSGIDVLYDDREDVSAGAKLADADLLGMPLRIVVSEKATAAGGVEVKRRTSEDISIIPGSGVREFLEKG
jgi:prolyl-tRNA synthetase